MDNVGYVALSAQVALRRSLDVTANNVANMNTAGYKADRTVFAEALARSGSAVPTPSAPSFAVDKHSWTDFSDGAVRETGALLDFAVSGRGFFGVETPEGIAYTRDGRFLLGPDGALLTRDGLPVLDAGGGPLVLPRGAAEVSVAKDGTVSVNGNPAGRIGVFDGDGFQAMRKTGEGRFVSSVELEPMDSPVVLQGMVEDSNVNGVAEMTRLIDVTRAYGSAEAIADTADKLARSAVERIGRA